MRGGGGGGGEEIERNPSTLGSRFLTATRSPLEK